MGQSQFNKELSRIYSAMKVFNKFMNGYKKEMEESNNELRDALKQLLTLPGVPQPCTECSHLDCDAVRYAKAAIAKAEGRKE